MSIFTRDVLRPWIEGRGFEIGDHSYGAPHIHSWQPETSRLIIGRYCSIAAGVSVFMGGNHHVEWVSTYPFSSFGGVRPGAAGRTDHPVSNGDVRIGNDVWIGQSATILSGITIGDGAVIGTEAFVTKNVPPHAIVAATRPACCAPGSPTR